MVKETIVIEEKKTVWVRFTSWLATSWLGKAWNWLFGGNDASKANAAKPNGGTPTQSQSQGEGKGPAPQQEPKDVGSIKFIEGKLVFAVTDDIFKELQTDYENVDSNGKVISEEFRADFLSHEGKALYITGRYEGRTAFQGYTVLTINSVATQDGKTVFGGNELKGMKDLLGLNDTTTEVKITEFSDVPSKAEVANPEPAANGKVPSSTSANPKQQHVAGNGQKK